MMSDTSNYPGSSSPRPMLIEQTNTFSQPMDFSAGVCPVVEPSTSLGAGHGVNLAIPASTTQIVSMNSLTAPLAEGNEMNKLSALDISNNTIDLAPMELYLSETCDLMWDRWEKLHKDFYSTKQNQYDLTKVPDVYDMIRYDLLHNSSLQLSGMEELFQIASKFERCVVPQEYGTDKEDKRYIGSKMCGALLEKIEHDLTIASANNNVSDPMLYQLDESHAEDLRINSFTRCVRTRLYFTSESHLHTVLNVLRFAKPNSPYALSKESMDALEHITDVSYLSQIIIRLFQDRGDSNKYSCEISFSSGTTSDPLGDKGNSITPYVTLEKSIPLEQLMGLLDESIELYRSTREERLLAEEVEEESMTDVVEHHPEGVQNTTITPNLETREDTGTGEHQGTPIPTTGNNSQHNAPVSLQPSLHSTGQNSQYYHSYHGNSPHALALHHSHYNYTKRSSNITVNMDELNSTSDRWEVSVSTNVAKSFIPPRSFSLIGLPNHIKVPRPVSLHPTYFGMLEDDDGTIVSGSGPRGSGYSNYTAFRARRGYNPSPQMKAYAETFLRKSSPSANTSTATATGSSSKLSSSVDSVAASASKTLDALSLSMHVPKGSAAAGVSYSSHSSPPAGKLDNNSNRSNISNGRAKPKEGSLPVVASVQSVLPVLDVNKDKEKTDLVGSADKGVKGDGEILLVADRESSPFTLSASAIPLRKTIVTEVVETAETGLKLPASPTGTMTTHELSSLFAEDNPGSEKPEVRVKDVESASVITIAPCNSVVDAST
jgi:hypothetical protein